MGTVGGEWSVGAIGLAAGLLLAAPAASSWAVELGEGMREPWCADFSVALPLRVERWVETATARVVVEAVLVVAAGERGNARSELAAAVRGVVAEHSPERVWRWTDVSFSRDPSGLDRVTGRAEIRAPADGVGEVWERAKRVSRPGLSVRVLSVEWAPSLAEREAELARARNAIYQAARQELAGLKEALGGNWRIGRIDLLEPRAAAMVHAQAMSAERTGEAASGDLPRAQRVLVEASVTLVEPRCGPDHHAR